MDKLTREFGNPDGIGAFGTGYASWDVGRNITVVAGTGTISVIRKDKTSVACFSDVDDAIRYVRMHQPLELWWYLVLVLAGLAVIGFLVWS